MSLHEFWTKWKGKLDDSLRKRGIAGTARVAAALAKRTLIERCHPWNAWNPLYRYLDKRFDRKRGVDTAGLFRLPELESDPRFKYSEVYDPTPAAIFSRLMRRINVDLSRFVFIDFGCGKGKVLLLAAELPFKQIIGVELSSKLMQVAEENLRSHLSRTRTVGNPIRLACMDASEFQLPREATICYFYNPFKEEVMRKVLENIRRSLAAVPRELYVLYLYPIHHALFEESRFLTPVKKTAWYAIYKASCA